MAEDLAGLKASIDATKELIAHKESEMSDVEEFLEELADELKHLHKFLRKDWRKLTKLLENATEEEKNEIAG